MREVIQTGHKIIVTGIGKSGTIGAKIASTLSSTGASSVVLDAVNASHGDLGMVSNGDLVLILSYSGETEEVARLIPSLKRLGTRIVALTGNPKSTLAREAEIQSTSTSRAKPARSISRPPPAPPPCWPSATRWPWCCSRRAASTRRTSPPSTPAARSGRNLLTQGRGHHAHPRANGRPDRPRNRQRGARPHRAKAGGRRRRRWTSRAACRHLYPWRFHPRLPKGRQHRPRQARRSDDAQPDHRAVESSPWKSSTSSSPTASAT